jgi:hypothetical protein
MSRSGSSILTTTGLGLSVVDGFISGVGVSALSDDCGSSLLIRISPSGGSWAANVLSYYAKVK